MGAESRWDATALSVVMLALMITIVSTAEAGEATSTFKIASQPLANALVLFAEQAGLAVMAPADLVRDKTAPALDVRSPQRWRCRRWTSAPLRVSWKFNSLPRT